MNRFKSVFLTLCIFFGFYITQAQPDTTLNLTFNSIPDKWDHGFPLGNGMIGLLVWQHDGMLRLSVDRADLWDLRPTADIDKYTYKWAYQQRLKGDFDTVRKIADVPYDRDAGPTKIPGAAIEFDISKLGPVVLATLNIASAICTIKWKNGAVFRTFVDATRPIARYDWQGISVVPVIKAPAYNISASQSNNNQIVEGSDLRRLVYPVGKISIHKSSIFYRQKAWVSFMYEVAVTYIKTLSGQEGCFTITSHYSNKPKTTPANKLCKNAIKTDFDKGVSDHKQWWLNY